MRAACGHEGEVHNVGENSLCWDCHLANLRKRGDPERANRLEELKASRSSHQLADWPKLVNAIISKYALDSLEEK